MKTTKKHLDIFNKECEKWEKLLGLGDWHISLCGIDENVDGRAMTLLNLTGKHASVWLSDDWKHHIKISDIELKIAAKHEMIHILIGRLTCISDERYVTENDRKEAVEELVIRLEKLL